MLYFYSCMVISERKVFWLNSSVECIKEIKSCEELKETQEEIKNNLLSLDIFSDDKYDVIFLSFNRV